MQEWFGSILFCFASSAEVKRITVLLGELRRRVPVDRTAGPPRLRGRRGERPDRRGCLRAGLCHRGSAEAERSRRVAVGAAPRGVAQL